MTDEYKPPQREVEINITDDHVKHDYGEKGQRRPDKTEQQAGELSENAVSELLAHPKLMDQEGMADINVTPEALRNQDTSDALLSRIEQLDPELAYQLRQILQQNKAAEAKFIPPSPSPLG